MGKFRFFLGAAAGAAAALLLAPRSGKETRQLLSEKLEDAVEVAPEPIRSAAGQVTDVYDRVSTSASEVAPDTDDIKAKIAEARDALAEQITRNHTAATTVEADVEDVEVPAADDLTAQVGAAFQSAQETAADAAEVAADAAEEAADAAADAVEEVKEAATDAAEDFKLPDWYK